MCVMPVLDCHVECVPYHESWLKTLKNHCSKLINALIFIWTPGPRRIKTILLSLHYSQLWACGLDLMNQR